MNMYRLSHNINIDILENIEYRKIKYIHNKIWIVSGYLFTPDMATLLKLKYPDLEFKLHDEKLEVIASDNVEYLFQLYDDPSEELLLNTVKNNG